MFADDYLLTQLKPIFLLLKIKTSLENLVILLTGSGYDQSGSTSLLSGTVKIGDIREKNERKKIRRKPGQI